MEPASTKRSDASDVVDTATITILPSDLLRSVAQSMNRRDTKMPVTLPIVTTWKTVLRATDAALGEEDPFCLVRRPRTEAQRLRLRQAALENVAAWKAAESSSSSEQSSHLPHSRPLRSIRTTYDITSLPSPKPLSDEARERLKENAKPFLDFREPYAVQFTANITEGTLPIVKANVTLMAVDGQYGDPAEEFKQIDVLWDTGAHQTLISKELMSETFHDYLQDQVHDPYRSEGGIRVQLGAVIGFTNMPVKISAIALVVPKIVMPNERIGIIFGQKQCIDSMDYHSTPRRILEAKGEKIDEEVWGDIVIHEVIDEDGDLVQV